MSQIAVFIDAGYFWVQVTHVLLGEKGSRGAVTIDYAALRQEVLSQASAQFPNAELMRVYWYDGPGSQGTKSANHLAIDELDDFKLRLGTRNGYGDQKAVDGLIIADLIGLAQSRSISGAIVMSGDADLTPGVTAAQSLGIRVHLLSLGPATATSPYLKAEVDRKAHWADPTVHKFAGRAALPVAAVEVASNPCEAVQPDTSTVESFPDISARVLKALCSDGTSIALEDGKIPKAADGRLLWTARKSLGRDLTELEKRALRQAFRHTISPQTIV